MEELYQAIEEKIKASGYPREISGERVYDDICDQIEGKENGTYLVLSNLRKMWYLSIISLFLMTTLIWEF